MIFFPWLILPCLPLSATVDRNQWELLSRSRAYAAWVVLCLVWGTTYLAIRVAIESIPPLLMAGVRWVVAGSLLIAFFRIRGDSLPERRQWLPLAVRGALLIGLGNGAVVWAEQTVPSGLAAVLVALVPFWMVGIDALAGGGKVPTIRQIAGLFIGFAGIVLLVSPNTRMVAGTGFWSGLSRRSSPAQDGPSDRRTPGAAGGTIRFPTSHSKCSLGGCC
jgi:drug/metabolite transporter (DMT)-like permease